MKKIIAFALLAIAARAGAAEFRLPAFETARLPNGLTVYLMERHEVPLIAVRAVVKAGSVNDGSQAGLANLTGASLLLLGLGGVLVARRRELAVRGTQRVA